MVHHSFSCCKSMLCAEHVQGLKLLLDCCTGNAIDATGTLEGDCACTEGGEDVLGMDWGLECANFSYQGWQQVLLHWPVWT